MDKDQKIRAKALELAIRLHTPMIRNALRNNDRYEFDLLGNDVDVFVSYIANGAKNKDRWVVQAQ
jgi:hypothetical protein